jgi:hypothetical protein
LLPQWGNRLSPTLVKQMELGKDITAEAVGRALLARTQLYRKVQAWFERFDVIVTPTLARTAIAIEERLFEPIEIEGEKTDTVRKAWYPYTHPFNLTGHPAMTPLRLPQRQPADGDPVRVGTGGCAPVPHRRPVRAGVAMGGAAADHRGLRLSASPGSRHRAKFRDDDLKHAERQLGLIGMRSLSQGGSKVSLTETYQRQRRRRLRSPPSRISPATGQPGDVSVISTATLRASSTSIL